MKNIHPSYIRVCVCVLCVYVCTIKVISYVTRNLNFLSKHCLTGYLSLLINFSKIHSHRFSLFFPIFRKSYYYNRVVVELLFSLAHRYKSRTRKSFYLLSHPTTNKIQTLSPIFVNKFLGLVSHTITQPSINRASQTRQQKSRVI